MIEEEIRFSLTNEEYTNLLSCSIPWSEPVIVTDITFGLSGATSMYTHGWVVRVRKKGEIITIEYKAPINKEWTQWEEIGFEVSSFSSALKFLKKIELKPGLVLDRQRREAEWNGTNLAIDDFKYLGKFIEIEINKNGEKAISVIDQCISDLGLINKESQKPYGSMLLDMMKFDESIQLEIEKHIDRLSEEGS